MTRNEIIAQVLSTPAHTDTAHAMVDATKVQRNVDSARAGINKVASAR